MLSTRKLVAAGAVFAVAASGLALAQAVPEEHQMRSDHQPVGSWRRGCTKSCCRR